MRAFSTILFTGFILRAAIIQAQPPPDPVFVFLPPGLHFSPLKADIQEPRIGILKFLDAGDMKVDIGNSIDLVEYSLPASRTRFTAGIDFMAYAFVTGSQGLRLQIDAIDGFFGGNVSVSRNLDAGTFQARLRVLHHSAHFVDGHYLQATGTWIDNRPPVPFTRDFGELTAAHLLSPSFGSLRYYGGISYATLVRPDDVRRFSYHAGFELFNARLIPAFLGQPFNMFIAYHIGLAGMPRYAGSNTVQAGIKFGQWQRKGPVLYVEYFNGPHMFAEYGNERLTTLGAGFTVDFF